MDTKNSTHASTTMPAGVPTRHEAEEYLEMARLKNPGPWHTHSQVTARAAKTIAARCGLDIGAAYALGLLHQVGRFEGAQELHYILAGHTLMDKMGYTAAAGVCLTHAFPYPDLSTYAGVIPGCTPQESAFIITAVQNTPPGPADMLIQLCSALCSPQGVCLLEVRFAESVRRHGFNQYTPFKWEALFALKAHFDTLCKQNIYALFGDEIRATSIR